MKPREILPSSMWPVIWDEKAKGRTFVSIAKDYGVHPSRVSNVYYYGKRVQMYRAAQAERDRAKRAELEQEVANLANLQAKWLKEWESL